VRWVARMRPQGRIGPVGLWASLGAATIAVVACAAVTGCSPSQGARAAASAPESAPVSGSASESGAGAGIPPLACSDGNAAAGQCHVGDIGPGGGVVFYDAGSRQSWGRYLEAAPAGWYKVLPSDPQISWCEPGQPGSEAYIATLEAIGTGAQNTEMVVGMCGGSSAAGMADDYAVGGKADWFLPSFKELEALARSNLVRLCDVERCRLWSSSQWWSLGPGIVRPFENLQAQAVVVGLDGPGTPIDLVSRKTAEFGVRPIRAF